MIALKSLKERESSHASAHVDLPSTTLSKNGSRRLKLKRKVIYTYEYSDDEEPEQSYKPMIANFVAAGQSRKEERISQSISSQIPKPSHSFQSSSGDNKLAKPIVSTRVKMNPSHNAVESKMNPYVHVGVSSRFASKRFDQSVRSQIRTGGFQRISQSMHR